MTMAEHTPGPWAWQWATDFNGNADGRIFTAWKTQIGIAAHLCVAVSPRYQSEEQWRKDANLIAAAPDLLAAIVNSDDAHWTPAMRAAIAKARGQER